MLKCWPALYYISETNCALLVFLFSQQKAKFINQSQFQCNLFHLFWKSCRYILRKARLFFLVIPSGAFSKNYANNEFVVKT